MRKIGKQNIRKIFKSNVSYAITLPVGLIRKLKWQEKQKLVIRCQGNKLVVSDWKKPLKKEN